MDKRILLILESCDTIHELKKEFNKKFGFLKIFSKNKMKKLINQVEDSIKQLENDKWTIDYLFNLEQTLYAYDIKLREYMKLSNFYISEKEELVVDPTNELANSNLQSIHHNNYKYFRTMYFEDNVKNTIINLDIAGENICFTIFDKNTGNSFNVISKNEVQKSQKKIEDVCKHILIDFLLKYLHEDKK